MEVEQEFAVVDIAAGRGVGVAEEELPAGVFARIRTAARERDDPVGVSRLVPVHQAQLPEVDRFDPGIDVAGLPGLSERMEHRLVNGDGFDSGSDDLERGGQEDDLRNGLVNGIGERPRRLEEVVEFLLSPPTRQRSPDELGPER